MRNRERLFLHLVAVYAWTLLGMHLLAGRLPTAWAYHWYPQDLIGEGGRLSAGEWLWGLYPYTYLPDWLGGILAAAVAVLIAWAGWGRLSEVRRKRLKSALRYPLQWHWQLLVAFCSFPLFYLGRVVHTRWGDAYLLVMGMAHPDVRLTYNWQAPLDTYVHARLFQLGEAWWGWENGLPAYWWLSSLAGAAALGVLLRMAGEMGRTDLQRWVVLAGMVTLGSMQLFFGYPENYTLISLLILLYLWLAWRVVAGRSSLWLPSIVLALAHGFHPATLVLQPSLWLLALIVSRRDRAPLSLLRGFLIVAIPALVVIGATFGLMAAGGYGWDAFTGAQAPGGGDASWLVPLREIETEWQYYTMFSSAHLLEIMNQQLLTMPFTLPILLLLILFFRRHIPRDGYGQVLLLAAAAYLLLTWVWNPDYGGQRDWDLFAPAAWPATLLMLYWSIRVLSPDILARTFLIVISVGALHTASWIYSNTLPWQWPLG